MPPGPNQRPCLHQLAKECMSVLQLLSECLIEWESAWVPVCSVDACPFVWNRFHSAAPSVTVCLPRELSALFLYLFVNQPVNVSLILILLFCSSVLHCLLKFEGMLGVTNVLNQVNSPSCNFFVKLAWRRKRKQTKTLNPRKIWGNNNNAYCQERFCGSKWCTSCNSIKTATIKHSIVLGLSTSNTDCIKKSKERDKHPNSKYDLENWDDHFSPHLILSLFWLPPLYYSTIFIYIIYIVV